MAPIVHGLEAQYAGKLLFAYLDIDDPANEAVKQQLGFRVQPEFYLVDGEGKVLKKWFGPVRAAEFEQAFAEFVP